LTCELEIEALAHGGNGIGRLDGKAVFVPLAAAGDRVACRIVREHKRYAEAELVEVLRPGPGRRPPSCPVFGECGGCQWQHLDYAAQCAWKERLFADQLERQAGVDRKAVSPLLAAPEEWNYRSRAQFKCRQTAAGFVMGFYRRGSHFVVDVPDCPISSPEVNRGLAAFRQWLPASPCPDRIPQVDLASDDSGQVRAVVHCLDPQPQKLVDFLRPLADEAGFALFLQTGRKATLGRITGSENLTIEVDAPPLQLAYGPGAFAQVNLDQNRALVAEVVGAVPWCGREQVLDLFCGMGNFSLPLARRGGHVVGVEGFEPAIEQARANASANKLGNLTFQAADAGSALAAFFPAKAPDVVLLDPPRSGAYAVCRELSKAAPARIVYVSCDPATLARDLVPPLHSGYRLARTRPIDLFPQTWHTESVSLLERTG
jgi:23S rRNA (uracil1939-C5)-methyltransferase